MENLLIKETNNTPFVSFNTNGELKLEGSSLPENSVNFYTPLWDWAKSASFDKITMEIYLPYFNTSSSKCLLELFRSLENNTNIKELNINWHYDEEDEDNLEAGQMYATVSKRAKFNYISR